MKKSPVLSLLLALCLAVSLLTVPAYGAESVATLSGAPGISVSYTESDQVTPGTIRYVNQVTSNSTFHLSYWNGYQSEAYQECGTASISMALSYIGINATPEVLANYWGGSGEGSFSTYFYNAPWVYGYYSGDFAGAYERYESGGGQYSPVILHLTSYSRRGHFVVVAGRIDNQTFEVVDPAKATIWQLTMIPDGEGNYDISYVKNGVTITDKVSDKDLGCYQYYNADISSSVSSESVQLNNPFTDVPSGWMEEGICKTVAAGLMTGITETTFQPSACITRAQLVQTLYHAAGSPKTSGACGFTDVAEDADYRDAVIWANDNRLLCGSGNKTYDPEGLVTRQQLLLVLQRYVSRYAGCEIKNLADLSSYTDCDHLSPSQQAVLSWAVGNGLITGSSSMKLEPDAFVTRGQMAVILNRLFVI